MNITIFNSVDRAYIQSQDQEIEDTWLNLVKLFMERDTSQTKSGVMLFNLAKFKNIADPTAELGRQYIYQDGRRTEQYKQIPNTVRRSKANLESISGIILDVDKGQRIEDAIALYSGLEYVIYTTFNHTFDTNRFRIIIPFTRPLFSADIAKRKNSIQKTFPTVDPSSFNVSQAFYFHSGLNDPIAYHNCGYMIDPYEFEEEITKPRATPSFDTSNTDIRDVEQILQELKKHYPDLENQVRMRVTWAVQSALGSDQTVGIMRTYWPDWEKTQKYESWCSTFRAGSIHLGSLVEMIRRHNPLFRRSFQGEMSGEQAVRLLRRQDIKTKKLIQGDFYGQ